MNEIVTTNWLFKNLHNKNLVILDCSWYLSSEKQNPKKNYNNCHIEGSHYFDIEEISDQKNKLPHMVPKINFFINLILRNFIIRV